MEHPRQTVEKAVHTALNSLNLGTEGVVVEYAADATHGDLATNAAMVHAKDAGKNPRELAEEIISALGDVSGVEKIEIAGPGFINFTLTNEVLSDVVKQVTDLPDKWGKNSSQDGKKVMVEYTQPNPFKPFHIGHLMSNTIGESIACLSEYSSAEVARANYQGDVGPHVAKTIWAIQKLGTDIQDINEIGRAYATGAKAYEEDEAAHAEIDALNRAVYERSDEQINRLYDEGRKVSLDRFEEIYQVLGTKFDHYFFESETAPIGKDIVQTHPDVFVESDGATVYHGEADGLHTRVFITKNGLPTYEAKDLGLLRLKANTWKFDQSITITASEQTDYFKVIMAAAQKVLPELADRAQHVAHGMMRLTTGKMSSRTGDVVTGESLLEKLTLAARERAAESKAEDADKLAEQIAVAAIKYQVLKQAAGKDIVFDEARALSLEGDSGPYIQYAHARAQSVIAAGENEGIQPEVSAPETDGERGIARLLMQFPDVVQRAQRELEPHYVANYAGELAALYNSWYAAERVLGTDDAPRRLALTQAVSITLKQSLWLLGIQSPERM